MSNLLATSTGFVAFGTMTGLLDHCRVAGETPWQVRWVRWWWTQHARRHMDIVRRQIRCACTGGGWPCAYEDWHRRMAAEGIRYANNARPFWLTTGKIPLVTISRARALEEMST